MLNVTIISGFGAGLVLGCAIGLFIGWKRWRLPVKVYAIPQHLVPTSKAERKKLKAALAARYRESRRVGRKA